MQYKRYFVAVVCAVMLVLFSALAYSQTSVQPLPDAAGLLPEFNRWRTAIGLHPYQEDTRLSMSAQFHSQDMINRNQYEHVSPSPVDCNGFPVTTPAQRAMCFGTWDGGEGLTVGHTDPAAATRGWISSFGHCTGVMNSNSTHMGGGHASTTNEANIWKEAWTFQHNGSTDLSSSIDEEAFCGCTRGKSTEADIQNCVTEYNNRFHNGTAPAPASVPLIERPLRRFPNGASESYNNKNSGGMCCFSFFPGIVTFYVVPVTGNPSGIKLELGDKDFNKFVDVSGTDTLTYTVTQPAEFSLFFNSASLPDGDTFYIEAKWEPIGGETPDVQTPDTSQPEVPTPDASGSLCSVSAGDVAQLISAIQDANDEVKCPGFDTITLTADIQPTAGFEGSDTAFPTITSDIWIYGGNFTLSRDASAPQFRFFLVDATQREISFSLQQMTLTGGNTLDAGAVLLDARNGGKVSFYLYETHFNNNTSNGNGGAVAVITLGGGTSYMSAMFSSFTQNSGLYGGAFYNGGFDGGNATAFLYHTDFTGNTAGVNGGAIYNNGLGANSRAEATLATVVLADNFGPQNDAIYNNGRSGGNATVALVDATSFTQDPFRSLPVIYNHGAEGYATVSDTSGGQVGGSMDSCAILTNMALQTVDCPANP